MLLEDYDILRQRIRELEEQTLKHKYEMDKHTLATNDLVPGLIETVRAAIPLIQFTAGNVPHTLKGWPWRSLYRFAELIKALPTATVHETELARSLKDVAEDIKQIEDERIKMLASFNPETLAAEQLELMNDYDAHMEELRKKMADHIKPTVPEQSP